MTAGFVEGRNDNRRYRALGRRVPWGGEASGRRWPSIPYAGFFGSLNMKYMTIRSRSPRRPPAYAEQDFAIVKKAQGQPNGSRHDAVPQGGHLDRRHWPTPRDRRNR